MATEPCSLDEAKRLRDEWSARGPGSTCADCEAVGFIPMIERAREAASPLGVYAFAVSAGFELATYAHGFIKRCGPCADPAPYGWIARIDLERIQTWMNSHPGEFALSELKELL